MNDIFKMVLGQGTITVTADRASGGHEVSDLFDIAQRRNPKRPFLFVSKILGKHIPVAPSKMRSVYAELANKIPRGLPTPILIVGMAETAVGLGAGVFEELVRFESNAVYLTSTRHPVEGDLLCEFTEDHSHATDHLIYLPGCAEMRSMVKAARTLILVDDEATTGNTFRNLMGSIMKSGHAPNIEKVVAVTLTDWSGNALANSISIPVIPISLMEGTWQWKSNPAALPVEMPNVNVTAAGGFPIARQQGWGRLGMKSPNRSLGQNIMGRAGERILVVGTGEFVYEPFLLAERLERDGANVKFSSTSRSPISMGNAIKSIISFSDNYGLGIPNYLYNVANQEFDRIILCSETSAESIDKKLLEALSGSATKVEHITYEQEELFMNKPVVLTDLDDTIFQTKRKMINKLAAKVVATGALNREGKPNSFMSAEQKMLLDWLLQSSDLIPVTARGTEELSRVSIDFTSWAITTHGAVILQPDGTPDPYWREKIIAELNDYQARLTIMQSELTRLMSERNINGFARINYEYDGVAIYLVMKHRDREKLHEIYELSAEIEQSMSSEGFYIHSNHNNIAWLPKPIEKGIAAAYLLEKLKGERGSFPVIGLGDSLTDYSFMRLCNWFGIPFQSQFAEAINEKIYGEETHNDVRIPV